MEYYLLPGGGSGVSLSDMAKELVGRKSIACFLFQSTHPSAKSWRWRGERGSLEQPHVLQGKEWMGQGEHSDPQQGFGAPLQPHGSSAVCAHCGIRRHTVNCSLVIVLGPLSLQIFREIPYLCFDIFFAGRLFLKCCGLWIKYCLCIKYHWSSAGSWADLA